MNSKITLARLAQLVAAKNGSSLDECEEVLRQLFRHISASLEAGDSIRIKGLGTFKLSAVEARKSVDVTSGEDNEIPAHNRIVFVPSKELAAAVNAPFDMFETITVEESILEEELIEAESEPNNLMTSTLQQQLILEEEKEDNLKKEYQAAFDAPVEELPEEDPEESVTVPEEEQSAEPEEESPEDSAQDSTVSGEEEEQTPASAAVINRKHEESAHSAPEYVPERRRKMWPWYVAAGLAVLLIGCGLLWWLNDDFSQWGKTTASRIFSRSEQPKDSLNDMEVATLLDNEDNLAEVASDQTGLVEEEMLTRKDSADKAPQHENVVDDPVPTQASDRKSPFPTTDTVTQTRYLTTIAKQHYGNFNLWPYIYKENEKILGHPNRIRPGTKVVVPDLAKYGVDPKNPDDIAKAKKLGVEIYKKYK